ncbi:MAG: strawberry notch family protein [Bryobacterales bacterium]|nr:strawberry notch family protein [Bryobacterales bacterium]
MADIRTILDPLTVDRSLKGDAWDNFHAATDEADFRARFDKLALPKEAKAALWDAKFAAPTVPGMEKLGPLPGVPMTQPSVEPVGYLNPLPKGTKVPGVGPEGEDLEHLMRQSGVKNPKALSEAVGTAQAGQGEALTKGTISGFNMIPHMVGGTLLFAGNQFQNEKLKAAGEGVLQRTKAVSIDTAMPTEYSADPLDDPSVLANPNWWLYTGSNAIASMAPIMGVGLAGQGAIAGAARWAKLSEGATRLAMKWGGAGLGGVTEGWMNGSGAYVDALERGATHEDAASVAAQVAASTGALAAVGLERGVLNTDYKTGFTKALASFFAEGAEEGITELIQNDLARAYYDPSRSLTDGVVQATLGGGIAGATMSGMGGRDSSVASPDAQPGTAPPPTAGTPPIAPPTATQQAPGATNAPAPVSQAPPAGPAAPAPGDEAPAAAQTAGSAEEAGDKLYAAAQAVLEREGKVKRGGLVNALGVNPKQAQGLLTRMYADGLIDQTGKKVKTLTQEAAPTELNLEADTELEEGEPAALPEERLGNTGKVATVRGTNADYRYAVVEADEAQTSNDLEGAPNPAYPEPLQPRDRTRAASQAQIADIAGKADYRQLADNNLPNFGAPVLGQDLNVEAGNGRMNALRLAYERGLPTAQRYREDLAADSERHGVDAKVIAGMKAPVLVRIRTSPVNRIQFARESNEDPQQGMSAAEIAGTDAGRIGGLLDGFDAESDVTAPGNRDFVRAFMQGVVSQSDRARLMTADGTLSQDGARRIKLAVFARAYGDPTAIETLAEATDSNTKAISDGMLRAAPKLAKVKEGIRTGALHDRDLTGDVAAAARKLSWLRQNGVTIDDFLAQQGLFGQEITPEAQALLRVFAEHGRAPKRVGEILATFAQSVEELGSPNQAGLFRGTTPASKGELLTAAVRRVLEKENPDVQKVDGARAGPDQRVSSAEGADGSPQAGRGGTGHEAPGKPAKPTARPTAKVAPSKPAAPSLFDAPAEEAAPSPPVKKATRTDEEIAAAVKEKLRVEAEAAEKRLKEKLRRLAGDTSGEVRSVSRADFDELLGDLKAIGAYKIASGYVRLQRFADAMVAQVGEWIREYSTELHEASVDHFEAAAEAERGDRPALAAKPAPAKQPVAPTQGALALDAEPEPEAAGPVAVAPTLAQLESELAKVKEEVRDAARALKAAKGEAKKAASARVNALLRKQGELQRQRDAARKEAPQAESTKHAPFVRSREPKAAKPRTVTVEKVDPAADLTPATGTPEVRKPRGPGADLATPLSSTTPDDARQEPVRGVSPPPKRAELERIEVDPRLVQSATGDVRGSYSADRISEKKPIRKPFRYQGVLHVATSIHADEVTAYELIPFESFEGESAVYPGPTDREDPMGGYHGLRLKAQGKDWVMQGPPKVFVAGKATSADGKQGGLFDAPQEAATDDDQRPVPEPAQPAPEGGRVQSDTTVEAEAETKTETPQGRLIARVREAIEKGEDIRLRLERIAEDIYGGKRADGKYTKREIYEAQEAALNGWLAAHGPELLAMPFDKAAAKLRGMLGKLATQTVRDDEQIRRQQFSTPPHIAYLVDRLAAPGAADVLLEPSAGTGGLVAMLRDVVGTVHANEIDSERAQLAEGVLGVKPSEHNAEIIDAMLDQAVKPTLVVMNPPFSAGLLTKDSGNKTKFGWQHLESALARLENGGRLVAILAGGRDAFMNREGTAMHVPTAREAWTRITGRYNVRANVRISGKEYAKYGTNFPVQVIVIDKSGPTPGATVAARLAAPIVGNFETVEEAYGATGKLTEDRQAAAAAPGPAQSGSGVADGQGSLFPGAGDVSPGVPANSGRVGAADRPGGLQRPTGRVEPSTRPNDAPPRSATHEAPPAPERADAGRSASNSERVRSPVKIEAAGHAGAAAEDTGAFVEYRPSIKGPAHPGHIVETKTMASVELPKLDAKLALPQWLVDEGKISAVQMEGVLIAVQANETLLPDGSRASAVIGDGTGVGKGRQIAAVLYDAWLKGHKRLTWVTENWRLVEDAIRDLEGIGAHDLARTLKRQDAYKGGDKIAHSGVLFTTYSNLRSTDKKGNERIEQLIQWVNAAGDGEGGVVVFDEAHALKNTVAGLGGKPTDTGKAVAKLNEKLKKLRVTYVSATAASELRNMGYLGRLGLWGPKTAFPGGFQAFLNSISSGGTSAMELVAREMKALGRYLSRTISFKGVVLREDATAELNDGQKEIYRKAAKAWRDVTSRADAAMEAANATGTKARSRFMAQFFGSQQRFFNLLLTAMKTPEAIEAAQKGLQDGYSVVITLVNTNEAAQNRQEVRGNAATEEDETDDLDFGPRDILVNLVRNSFPTQQFADAVDSEGNEIKIPVTRPNPEPGGKPIPVENPEAVRMRDALIKELEAELHLPANPLDLLIEGLGGRAAVAELTGRQKYYDPATRKFVTRGDAGTPRQKVNIVEAEKFQAGKKRVAILSNAASTGISLHADNTKANTQPRLHITLQAGWSADKAMQMLGRTHRTNQASAPEYVMIVSDLGGEKRFISTIAKRLGSLGALTKGSRSAAGANAEAIDKVNFDSDQGEAAAQVFYRTLLRDQALGETGLNGRDVLDQMGVLKIDNQTGAATVDERDQINVNRLLNRLLSLDPDVQNAAYDLFYDSFEAAVAKAEEEGTLDTGVKVLPGANATIVSQQELSKDPDSGAPTTHVVIRTEHKNERLSPEQLDRWMKRQEDGDVYRIVHGRTGEASLVFAYPAPPIVHANGSTEQAMYVARPSNPRPQKTPLARLGGRPQTLTDYWKVQIRDLDGELQSKRRDIATIERQIGNDEAALTRSPGSRYYEASLAANRERLESLKERVAAIEAELEPLQSMKKDDVRGEVLEAWRKEFDATPEKFTRDYDMIGGAVLRWWGVIRDAGYEGIYAAQDSKTGERVVGVVPSEGATGRILQQISGGRAAVTPRQLYEDVLRNGTQYTLEGGLRVSRGYVSRTSVVQFQGSAEALRALVGLGVRMERGVAGQVHYVTNDKAGFAALERAIERYPVRVEGNRSRGDRARPYGIPKHLLGAATFRVEQGSGRVPARVMMNPEGLAVLHSAAGIGGELDYEGFWMPRAGAEAAAHNLRRSIVLGKVGVTKARELWRLAGAIDRSAKLHGGIVLADETADDIDALMRHENWHHFDTRLGIDEAREFIESNVLAGVARQSLMERGYPNNPSELVSEFGAHLQEGSTGWAKLGLTDQQALELWRQLSPTQRGVLENPFLHPTLRSAYEQRAGQGPDKRGLQAGGGNKTLRLDVASRAARSRRTFSQDDGTSLFDRGEVARVNDASARDREKLTGERLSAEFGSPLNRHNRTRPLKPAKDSGTGTLFGEEAPKQSTLADLWNDTSGELRLPSTFADVADLVRPLSSLVSNLGAAGKQLGKLLERAADVGEVRAGARLAALEDLHLGKLSREDRFHLVDVLEGRAAPKDTKIAAAADGVRAILSDLAGEAMKTGVLVKEKRTILPGDPRPITLTKLQHAALDKGHKVFATLRTPFSARSYYFPHTFPHVDKLAGKTQVRRDVIENLVRIGSVSNALQAASFLDAYVRFMQTGGREDRLIQFMVRTGQAKTETEAWLKLQRYRTQSQKRQGSLEYRRQVNLPFYDPDPTRVLPHSIASQSIRLAQIQYLGQDNEKVKKLAKKIRDVDGDKKAQWLLKAVDEIMGKTEQGDSPMERLSRTLRTIEGFRLGLAGVRNIFQGGVNSLIASDLISTLEGLRGLTTKQGRRFGVQSGAALESVINESLRHAGADGEHLTRFLRAVGFSQTERANRIVAANAGAAYARRLLDQLSKTPGDAHARRRLGELLGVDPAAAIARGHLVPGEVLIAAKRFSDLTQFRSRPQDLPEFAGSAAGKVFFQFKSYIYGQTRLLQREIVDEVRSGNYGRGMRTLLTMALVAPTTGALATALLNVLKGRDDDDDLLWRWLKGWPESGALGVLGDLTQAAKYGRIEGFILGPALSDVSDIAGRILRLPTAKDKAQALRNLAVYAFRQTPLVGPLLTERVFPKKKLVRPEMGGPPLGFRDATADLVSEGRRGLR